MIHHYRNFLIPSFLLLTLIGCQSAPTSLVKQSPKSIPVPMLINGVSNFAEIAPGLYRGSQPDVQGFQTLSDTYHIKTIIDLRSTGDDKPLIEKSDREFRLIRLHAKPWHPEDEDVVRFLQAMRDPANRPIFIHCAQGCDRTGWFIATYRIVEQEWDKNDALYEMYRFGYHPIWWLIRRHIDHLDVESIRNQLSQKSLIR